MAGSLKWFVYTTDNGESYALKADESNVEAVNGSTQDFLNDSELTFAVPRNVRVRYALYSNTDNSRQIKCPVLTPTIYAGVPENVPTITDPIGGGTLGLRRIRPELISLPFGVDTGLNDGDAT
jgi:hypothetical protein